MCIGLATDGNEHAITQDGFSAFDFNDAACAFRERGVDLGSQSEFQALLLEQFLRVGGDLRVYSGQDAIEVFEDGDFRAKTTPDRAEFKADVTGADDDEVFGDRVEPERLGAGADALAVEYDVRKGGRYAPSGDDDVFGFEFATAC